MDAQGLGSMAQPTLSVVPGALLFIFSICIVSFLVRSSQKTSLSMRSALPRVVWRRLSPWAYLFRGPSMIQHEFEKSKGRPFEMMAPDGRYVFVSSKDHIQEIDKAPDTVLSLQAASKQMLQPRYTMYGFNWFDRRGTEGVGFVRALRTLLTNNLPQILPDLGLINKSHLQELLSNYPVKDGSIDAPVYNIIVKLVVLSNAVSFFGKDLAKNEQFMVSALAYIEETLLCAEAVRLVPKFMVPLVGGIISSRIKSHSTIFYALLPIAEQRVLERELKSAGQSVPHHADCIQWILETSPKQNPWTAERVVHELMAIWFGSVHALSTTITFAIQDLCLYPEYVKPLREELMSEYGEFEKTSRGLSLLDSFIKESARLTPVESSTVSTRRCATQPFTLSDGTSLQVGDWACTPVKAMMQSAEFYPDPLRFNGFRFVEPGLLDKEVMNNPALVPPTEQKKSKLVDSDNTWHMWGTGRMVCPGRHYAAAIMKVIMGQVILNYECKLVEPEAPRWFTWRSSMLPKASTLVTFTPRKME